MGIEEIYRTIYDFFQKAFDENWLYIAAIIVVGLMLAVIIGGGLYVIVKARETPQAPDPNTLFIEANAPKYCQDIGFDSWRWKNNTQNRFECFNRPNETKEIMKFLNMS